MINLPNKKSAGFTLVEMAIVLVIIGLILGGVLKGQELVVQARVKSLINDFNQVTAAYYTYFDRYKRFPGDDKTASDRWTPNCYGDGNGVLGTAGTGYDSGDENKCMWRQMRIAGIINGDSTSDELPKNALDGNIGIQDGGAFGSGGLTDTVICSNNLPAKIAELIDYAIDDGIPNKGLVMSGTAIGTLYTDKYENQTARLIVCRKL